MPYPAKVYVYPTLIVNGQKISSDQYHTTYTWTGNRRMVVKRTTDKVNHMEIYSEIARQGIQAGCAVTVEDMTHAVNWVGGMGVIDSFFNGSTPCTRAYH